MTLSRANGRNEAWGQDRTGHTTSAMLNRYRRAARSASELGLGALRPLDQAIPELVLPSDYPANQTAGETDHDEVSRIIRQAEVAEPADAADSKSVSRKGV